MGAWLAKGEVGGQIVFFFLFFLTSGNIEVCSSGYKGRLEAGLFFFLKHRLVFASYKGRRRTAFYLSHNRGLCLAGYFFRN